MRKGGKKPPGKSPGESLFRKVAENLYRHKSSDVYYALVKRGGKQFRRSLKTTDRKLADRRLVSFKDKVSHLNSKKLDRSITFSEVAAQWLKTIKSHLKESSALRRVVSVNQLKPYFGNVPVANITVAGCEEWASKRHDKIAASTFNKERETLIAVIDYAIREGLTLDNPAYQVKKRKQEKTVILIPSKDEFSRLIRVLRSSEKRLQRAADLIELLAYSGMRLGEATEIRWHDIDFERECFVVTGGSTGTKNHESRIVPLFPALSHFLKQLQERYLYRENEKLIGIGTAKKALIAGCKKAEIKTYTHHSLRHYFVSNAIEAGIDFKTIAAWIGHKDGGLLVAKTYGHLRDTHSMEMAKRMTFSITEDKT